MEAKKMMVKRQHEGAIDAGDLTIVEGTNVLTESTAAGAMTKECQ